MAVAPDKKTTRSESQTKIDTLRAKVVELKARVEELEAENLALKKFSKPSAGNTPTAKATTATDPDTKQFFAKKRAIAEMDATSKAKKATAEKNRRFKKNAADAKLSTPTGKKSKSKFFDNSPGLQAKRDSRNAARVAARPKPKPKVK